MLLLIGSAPCGSGLQDQETELYRVPLQATALTHIVRLHVSYILQYLAIYS